MIYSNFRSLSEGPGESAVDDGVGHLKSSMFERIPVLRADLVLDNCVLYVSILVMMELSIVAVASVNIRGRLNVIVQWRTN